MAQDKRVVQGKQRKIDETYICISRRILLKFDTAIRSLAEAMRSLLFIFQCALQNKVH